MRVPMTAMLAVEIVFRARLPALVIAGRRRGVLRLRQIDDRGWSAVRLMSMAAACNISSAVQTAPE